MMTLFSFPSSYLASCVACCLRTSLAELPVQLSHVVKLHEGPLTCGAVQVHCILPQMTHCGFC